MGSDDLFHKRKAQKARDLKKRFHRRARYAKVLIVCEGGKTEPNYFRELRNHYRLEGTNVIISGDCGSDPVSVVEEAKEQYAWHRNSGDPFDRVYCVFDRDTHAGYSQATDILNRARPKDTFFATTSVPCFEYWVLLHFEPVTRPFRALPGNSACNQVISLLNNYMLDYEKGREGLFGQLIDQLEFAIHNAKRVNRQAQSDGTDNPSTRIHDLVEYLRSLDCEA